jgi:hypothetical protein
MTKDELIQYLRVCADLADAPKDGIAHVAIVPLRQAIQFLESSAEPPAPQICHWRCCTKPMAPGDSYLCAEHRALFGPARNRNGDA